MRDNGRIGPGTDWEQAVNDLVAERERKVGGKTSCWDQQFAVKRLDPALRAARLGHTVEWDPPAALTAAERWTCIGCGAAILARQGDRGRLIYGSAAEYRCTAPEAARA